MTSLGPDLLVPGLEEVSFNWRTKAHVFAKIPIPDRAMRSSGWSHIMTANLHTSKDDQCSSSPVRGFTEFNVMLGRVKHSFTKPEATGFTYW